MLVLSRKKGQQIKIGDNITITVTRVGGNQVRLGIDAPMETPVRRGELRVMPEPAAGTGKPLGEKIASCLTMSRFNAIQEVFEPHCEPGNR